MGDDENVMENLAEIEAKEHAEHPFLEPNPEDSEAKRVVKRLLNWYWGYDEAEGSQEITDILYELGLCVEPDDIHAERIQQHLNIANDLKSDVKFYQDKAMKYLERIEGLEHLICTLDPNCKKMKVNDMSSLTNKFPYADAELRKEVERANRRESATIDALCDAKSKYDELLDKYWKLKMKYEPEASSSSDEGQVCAKARD